MTHQLSGCSASGSPSLPFGNQLTRTQVLPSLVKHKKDGDAHPAGNMGFQELIYLQPEEEMPH